MVKKLLSGAAAGVLISIGGAVYLSCENKVVGAVLFAVALLCICIEGYSLYTGKICYMAEKHDKEAFSVLLLGILGNLLATVACGYLLRYAVPAIGSAAESACAAKLLQHPLSTFVRGCFCGNLIYLAVDVFKKRNSVIGILFCIPVFILCGFEHSIADMFYFAASGIVSLNAFWFIGLVILGNTVGGMLLPVLTAIGTGKRAEQK